jgi:hypothetical protein
VIGWRSDEKLGELAQVLRCGGEHFVSHHKFAIQARSLARESPIHHAVLAVLDIVSAKHYFWLQELHGTNPKRRAGA